MSFLITRNIGSNIEQLILRGLGNSGVTPPPEPTPTPETGAVGAGVPFYLFSSTPSAFGESSAAVALLAHPCLITWITSFDTTPAVASIILEGSLDGTHFFTLDTMNQAAGDIRHEVTGVRFIRTTFGTMDAGVLTTVVVSAFPISAVLE